MEVHVIVGVLDLSRGLSFVDIQWFLIETMGHSPFMLREVSAHTRDKNKLEKKGFIY